MIILRNKCFGGKDNRTPIPSEQKFTADPEIEAVFGKMKLVIEASKSKWQTSKSKLSITDQKIVDKLKNDIKRGYLYEDGPAGGDTHFLEKFSHKTGNNKSTMMSKFINYSDRLNYRIYPPEVKRNTKTGEVEYIQRIVLESCEGHGRNGARNYSTIN